MPIGIGMSITYSSPKLAVSVSQPVMVVGYAAPVMTVQMQLDRDYVDVPEFVTYTELVQKVLRRAVGDVVTYTDMLVINDNPVQADAFTASEQIAKELIKVIADVVTYTEQVIPAFQKSDVSSTIDQALMSVTKPISDVAAISELVAFSTLKSVSDASSTSDGGVANLFNYVQVYASYFAEAYVVGDTRTF